MKFQKIADDFQLGHLYEHIFLNQFTNQLRKAGFFAYLDYEIYGETYSNGFITIDFRSFSDECTIFFSSNFFEFKVDLSEEEISIAAIQIFSEKKMISDGFFEGYEDELMKISMQDWRELNLAEFEKEPEKNFDSWLDLVESDNFRTTFLELRAPKKINKTDFYNLAKIAINTASEDIEREIFCFTEGVYEDEDSDFFISGIRFRKSNLQDENFKLEIHILQNIINRLVELRKARREIVEAVEIKVGLL